MIIFLAFLIGLVFITRPKFQYKISTEEMLTKLSEKDNTIYPAKFMHLYYSNDSISKYRFIDLRPAPDFLKDHLPGAINIPVNKLLNDENTKILNQDEKINILYHKDQCGACGPWMIMTQLGYKNNKVLMGGYDYIKKHIIDNYSPMTGNYRSENAKYDYAKIINETAGGVKTKVDNTSKPIPAPVKTKKKEVEEEEGGC